VRVYRCGSASSDAGWGQRCEDMTMTMERGQRQGVRLVNAVGWSQHVWVP
jgi:hypothetical protein